MKMVIIMNVLKITLSSSIIALSMGGAHAHRTCINFSNGTGNIEGIEREFNEFSVVIKSGELTVGNGSTKNGPADYRRANPECNDNSVALFMNNSSLYISVVPQEVEVTEIEVDYCDFGGISNISARHSQVDYIGALKGADGKTLVTHNGDNAPVAIENLRTIAGGSRGDVVFAYDDIREFTIGGSELFINNICFEH